jgi:NADPH:quinone reductase-like Zn-dependent oxidoreductase
MGASRPPIEIVNRLLFEPPSRDDVKTLWMPTPADEQRGVRAVDVFVRSDAEQLSRLVALVDSGELRVDVADPVPLAGLPAVHAKADTGTLPGKVLVVPAAA